MAEQDIVERLREPVEVTTGRGFLARTNFVIDPLRSEAASIIASLRQQLADARETIRTSVFRSDGNEEQRWIEDQKIACPHCGGSGHVDDSRALPHPDREGERE